MHWLSSEFEPGLVSVIIPTFRRPELLSQSVQSFFEQTYRPLEIIVVEDGATEETKNVADQLANACPPGIRFQFIQQQNQGAPVARNRGAQECRGEYIVFTDDDDIASRSFVEQRMTAARQFDADVVYGPWTAFKKINGQYLISETRDVDTAENCQNIWSAFLRGWRPLLQSFLLKRSVVDAVGPWDESLLKGQDLDYKARVFAKDFKYGHAGLGCMYYRQHFQSISKHRRPSQVASIVRSVKTVEELSLARADFGDNQSYLASYLWYFAFRLFSRNAITEGLELIRRAMKHDANILRKQKWLTRTFVSLRLGRLVGRSYFVREQLRKFVMKLMGRHARTFQTKVAQLPN